MKHMNTIFWVMRIVFFVVWTGLFLAAIRLDVVPGWKFPIYLLIELAAIYGLKRFQTFRRQ